jgi:two-component sensor histidine kinase
MFRNKERLLFIAMLITGIFFVTFFFVTRSFIQKMRKDEHRKIEIWAEAVNQQAQVLRSATEYFEQVKKSEQNNMAIWAKAFSNLVNLEGDFDFNRRIVNSNNDIPYIVVEAGKRKRINMMQNTGIDPKTTKYFEGDLLEEYSHFPPINITGDSNRIIYRVYYKHSTTLTGLQNVVQQLVSSFIDEVVDNSVSVPVIMIAEKDGSVMVASRIDTSLYNTPEALDNTLDKMFNHDEPIKINDSEGNPIFTIYYEDSDIIKNLARIPYFIAFFVFVLMMVVWLAYIITKKSEDNKLWVGMSKETAHQLGTPISSLVAWNEYLKEQHGEQMVSEEIEKDILRLKTISERFSKIGSKPALEEKNITEFVEDAIEYLKNRLSKTITFKVQYSDNKIVAKINTVLMQWVVENMLKNAVDAIGTKKDGGIVISICRVKSKVIINISDNGKGMPKSLWKKIFNAGFTTKSRGWGLGLALCKRIVNEYHGGKVYVLTSTICIGTMFRIELKHF